MSTGIRDFCINYNKKLKNDKNIKEEKLDLLYDYRDRITFNINMHISCPNTRFIGQYTGQILFNLDEQDLEYLHKKYSKKIKDEMEQNIEKIKDTYKLAELTEKES
jgi:hypothetical protein